MAIDNCFPFGVDTEARYGVDSEVCVPDWSGEDETGARERPNQRGSEEED